MSSFVVLDPLSGSHVARDRLSRVADGSGVAVPITDHETAFSAENLSALPLRVRLMFQALLAAMNNDVHDEHGRQYQREGETNLARITPGSAGASGQIVLSDNTTSATSTDHTIIQEGKVHCKEGASLSTYEASGFALINLSYVDSSRTMTLTDGADSSTVITPGSVRFVDSTHDATITPAVAAATLVMVGDYNGTGHETFTNTAVEATNDWKISEEVSRVIIKGTNTNFSLGLTAAQAATNQDRLITIFNFSLEGSTVAAPLGTWSSGDVLLDIPGATSTGNGNICSISYIIYDSTNGWQVVDRAISTVVA
uniref:Uncharacterized protein n=1 Tax=viral metagenome TaxID=1070528 RepID=A0A2V0R9Z2_9ZZZZ